MADGRSYQAVYVTREEWFIREVEKGVKAA